MGRLRYLLDSNILSEPARLKPHNQVLQRLAEHDGEYATAAIVWHELVFGCELLAVSKRKTQLKSYLDMLSVSGLRILPFDQDAADWYGKERARLQRQGLMCSYADGEIAAIAVTQQLILVTPNTQDFEHFLHLSVENWFQ